MKEFDFAEFVTDLDHGAINEELTSKLARIVEAVEETGNQGVLTIKIKVSKEGRQAKVDVQADGKEPSHPLHGTFFFFAKEGGLTREDPRQMQLKYVDAEDKQVSFKNVRRLNGGDNE